MRLVARILVVLALCALGLGTASAGQPLQLAFWPPIQLVPEDEGITGLRLEIYGRNSDVSALDLGLIHEATGTFKGLAFGLASIVEEDMHGLQWTFLFCRTYGDAIGWPTALWTMVNGDFRGLQTSGLNTVDGEVHGVQLSFLYNLADQHISGVQVGLVNRSASVKGLQLGLVNLTDQMQGVQIGLWNQIDSKQSWNVIPIVNAKF